MNRESPELSGFLQLSDQELFLYSPGSQYYFWETMSEGLAVGYVQSSIRSTKMALSAALPTGAWGQR